MVKGAEKPAPPARTAIRTPEEHAVQGKMIVDRVREFAEDSSRDEMVNWGAGPSQQRAAPPIRTEALRADIGTSGIFTLVEAADLKVYRSILPEALMMPHRPVVSVVQVFYNRGNPVTDYHEGMVMLKGICPNGETTWFVVSMPVATQLMCDMGVAWGFPKYVADEMTLTPTKAVTRYEGAARLSLEFTPGTWDDIEALQERGLYGINDMAALHPTSSGTPCLLRFTYGPLTGFAERRRGTVKVYVRPEDPWAQLIPAGAETPGVYQRYVGSADTNAVIKKVKS